MVERRGFLLAGQAAAILLAIAALVTTAATRASRASAGAEREADRLNARGVAAYEAGRYLVADSLFQSALDLAPDNDTIRQNLALTIFAEAVGLAMKDGSLVYDERALALLRTASGFDPSRAEFHAALGRMYFLGSRFTEARIELGAALRLRPDDAQSIFLLGEIDHREGDVPGALEAWDRAAALAPGDSLIRQRLDQAAREDGIERRFASREHRHFALRYDVDPAGVRDAAEEMLTVLEDAYSHIGHELGIRPEGTISVVVYEESDFRALTGLHDWARGVYDGRIRVPYAALRRSVGSMRQVFYHEYTHAAIFYAARGRCPVWLNEGLAMLMSGEWSLDEAEALEDAAKNGGLYPLAGLDRSFVEEADASRVHIMYGESYIATRYLYERFGRFTMTEALTELGAGHSMDEVLESVYHLGMDDLDREMRRRIERGEYRS